ncbi:MAG: trypsin-like peptidase domain-containing protein [Flavobacteriaceae bacterium]|nr:trypsin-like peptidase domain-containing protein [Flavobacteriaceae bacterium]
MKQRFLIITLGLIFSLTVLGQEKIYYDTDWQVVKQSNAAYYRIVSFDTNGKPVGIVKDYYLSGVLQWEGQFTYMDTSDNSKDIADGNCTFYTRDGKKEHTDYYKNGKLIKPSLYFYYYPNGTLKSEIRVKDGDKNGESIWYYENGETKSLGFYKDNKANGLYIWFTDKGEISSVNEYKNDVPIDKFWINYDSYTEKFSKYFSDNFSDSKNPNDWHIGKDGNGREATYSKGSILYEFSAAGGHRNSIALNLVNNRDYTISINLKRISGPKGNPFGLIWGLKDWNNYNYFYISSRGSFTIGSKIDGFDVTDGWVSKPSAINTSSSNEIRVKKIGDKTYFAVNGRMVTSKDSFTLSGTQIGFMIYGNGSKILMENIEVTQEFTKKDFRKLIAPYYDDVFDSPNTTRNNEPKKNEWKGNGTGFFIDRNGYIATNYHVVKEANTMEVEFIRNGIKQTYPAKIIQSDKQNDLTILKIDAADFTPFLTLPYNFKTNISEVGSNIFALGYPMALSLMGTEIKFTDGKISSKTGIQGDVTTYQISVPIQPGNSGGPLFDYDGNLIGITSSGINRTLDLTENVNYAIKSSYLKNLVDVLDSKLRLPNDKLIARKTLTEKIKILSDYVVLIKIK